MKNSFRVIGVSTLLLLFGVIAISKGQQGKPEEQQKPQQQARAPQQQQQKPQQQAKAPQQQQQKPQQQARAPQQQQANGQRQQQSKTTNQQGQQVRSPQQQQQQQRQPQAASSQRPQRTQQAMATQRSQPAIRLSSRGCGRIPDARFHSNFGREYEFRMGNPVMVSGYSRFRYGGYWFGFVDPWPVGWYYTDDVYIDYVDGEYYMYDPYYPGARFAISVVL